MTSVTSKHVARKPLGDKTNALNMKSGKTKDVKRNKEINVQAPHISLETCTRENRKVKIKRTLPDAAVYQNKQSHETSTNEYSRSQNRAITHKVKPKRNIRSQKNNVPIIEPNEVDILGRNKRELFVKVTKIPSNENDKVIEKSDPKHVTCLNKNGKTNAVNEIKSGVNECIRDQVLDNIAASIIKDTDCAKELFVKIPKISENSENSEKASMKRSNRIRRKSIVEPVDNVKIVTDENKDEYVRISKEPVAEMKNGRFENSTLVTEKQSRECRKELLVKVTRISENDNKCNKTTKQHKNNVENTESKEKNLVTNIDSSKKLFVKVTQILDNNSVIMKSMEKQKSNSGNHNMGKTVVINLKNIISPKKLYVKVAPIPHNNEVNKRIEHQTNNPENTSTRKKMLKKVNFHLTSPPVKESHNLRKLEPKNYVEDSIINSIDNNNPDKSVNELIQINLQKKDGIPIYKKKLLEEPENNKQGGDLYEFVDVSPKSKKVRKKRSSIVFDKNTYEILQKIEEKEAKLKKKVFKKQKKILKPVAGKSYEKIVNDIVSNLREKISKKTKDSRKLKSNQNLVPNSKKSSTQNPINNEHEDQNSVPLNDSHKKVILVNSFSEELNIIVHNPAEVPLNQEKIVPQIHDAHNNIGNISSTRNEKGDQPNSKLNKENVAARKDTEINKSNLDTSDKLKKSENVIQPVPSPIPQDSVSISSDANNSLPQNDIDSCFGFDNDSVSPLISTPKEVPVKDTIKNLENITLRRRNQYIESPIDFNFRRPNANSTMIHIGTQNRTPSPWRPNWVNMRHNPHFVSVKTNALPRIDQDLVMDHTIVEGFESHCSNASKKGNETPAKKAPVQQSILDFVDCNVEKENEPLECSLFDYEAFNSPKKKTKEGKQNQRVEAVKKNVLGKRNNVVSSTPVKRKVLGDISNSSEEQVVVENTLEDDTYFGFTESSPRLSPKKFQNKDQENIENDNASKPSRFKLSALKRYSARNRNKKKVAPKEQQMIQVPDESISLMEVSDEGLTEEVHLFEEPEEMLDNMSPVHIGGKKQRRKRLDSSSESQVDESEKKRKRPKKTKLEVEQEQWIQQFNQECAEIDQHELELD